MSTINPLDIKFYPSVVHGIYGINYYIHTENGDRQRIQFEAAIAYCGQYMDEYAIYHISKREFIVNKNESDAYLYDIAKRCTKAIYPITILLDKNGKLVYVKTYGFGEKWVATRMEIDRLYKGEMAEQYLDNVEQFLNNEIQIWQMVAGDLFFNPLFAIEYNQLESRYQFENEISLVPFKEPLKFSSIQYRENAADRESNTINVIHSGETNQPYAFGALYHELAMSTDEYNSKLSVKYRLCYNLDKDNLHIDSIKGEFKTSVNDKLFSTTELCVLHLDEKPLEYEKDIYLKKVEKEQKLKNGSLWEKIINIF